MFFNKLNIELLFSYDSYEIYKLIDLIISREELIIEHYKLIKINNHLDCLITKIIDNVYHKIINSEYDIIIEVNTYLQEIYGIKLPKEFK